MLPHAGQGEFGAFNRARPRLHPDKGAVAATVAVSPTCLHATRPVTTGTAVMVSKSSARLAPNRTLVALVVGSGNHSCLGFLSHRLRSMTGWRRAKNALLARSSGGSRPVPTDNIRQVPGLSRGSGYVRVNGKTRLKVLRLSASGPAAAMHRAGRSRSRRASEQAINSHEMCPRPPQAWIGRKISMARIRASYAPKGNGTRLIGDSPDGSPRLPTTVTLRAPHYITGSKPAWQVVIRPLSG